MLEMKKTQLLLQQEAEVEGEHKDLPHHSYVKSQLSVGVYPKESYGSSLILLDKRIVTFEGIVTV